MTGYVNRVSGVMTAINMGVDVTTYYVQMKSPTQAGPQGMTDTRTSLAIIALIVSFAILLLLVRLFGRLTRKTCERQSASVERRRQEHV
jgi:hypothetical protein